MEVSWIEHKGHKILFADYRGAKTTEELLELLEKEIEIERGLSQPIPVLINIEGIYVNVEYMSRVKKYGKEVRNQKVKKTAMLGVTNIQKALVTGYILFTGTDNLKIFPNQEEALDWLIE